MDFAKGAAVDKIIDQAADVAKEKVGSMIGGGKKTPKEKKPDGAAGDPGNATSDTAGKKVADQALAFGKGLLK